MFIKSLVLVIILFSAVLSEAQQAPSGSMALGPARFELEMQPGTETTVVVGLDYKAGDSLAPVRIVASLNDWTLTREGQVQYFPANTLPNSAASWLLYSPGEAAVTPGTIHQIRVTISVPANATPGDHLAALIVEQRPETLKYGQNARQVVVRYRMASVFYIKVPGLTREGDLADLTAQTTPSEIIVSPMIKNLGNSMIRPTASISIVDETGKQVADLPESETLPVLAGSEIAGKVVIPNKLAAGKYTVKYRVDFQDGKAPTEGVAQFVVGTTQVASVPTVKKP